MTTTLLTRNNKTLINKRTLIPIKYRTLQMWITTKTIITHVKISIKELKRFGLDGCEVIYYFILNNS